MPPHPIFLEIRSYFLKSALALTVDDVVGNAHLTASCKSATCKTGFNVRK